MGEAMRGGAQRGGSHEGDEAELNLDIKHRGSDVKAVARGPEMSGRSGVLTPFPALPWESHACCNNVATDFIPLPPRLFTLNLLPVSKNWQLDCVELVQRVSGFLESLEGWEINHFCVCRQKNHLGMYRKVFLISDWIDIFDTLPFNRLRHVVIYDIFSNPYRASWESNLGLKMFMSHP